MRQRLAGTPTLGDEVEEEEEHSERLECGEIRTVFRREEGCGLSR